MAEVAHLERKNVAPKRRSKRGVQATPLVKRRVRTGCLTCRSKHKKCDEHKPVCNFCSQKGYDCVWKGSKKLDLAKSTLNDFLSLQTCAKNLVSLLNCPIATTVAFETTELVHSSTERSTSAKSQSAESLSPSIGEPLVLSSYLQSNANIYTTDMSHNSVSCLGDVEQNHNTSAFFAPCLFEKKSSLRTFKLPSRFFSLPKTLSSILSVYLSVHGKRIGIILPNDEYTFEVFTDRSSAKMDKLKFYDNIKKYPFLFDTFKGEIATMLSSTADQMHIFTDIIPKLSIHFPALHYAILTLSSRLLEENSEGYSGKNTLNFYNSSLRELGLVLKEKVSLESPITSKMLLATILFLEFFESLSLHPEDLDHRFDVYAVFISKICNTWKADPIVKALAMDCLVIQLLICTFQQTCHVTQDLFNIDISSPYYKLLCLSLELERESFENEEEIQIVESKLSSLKNGFAENLRKERLGQAFFVDSEELACSELYLTTIISIETKKLHCRRNCANSENKDNVQEDSADSLKYNNEKDMTEIKRNVKELLTVLHINMGWKNRHSVSCLMVSLYCLKKILDNPELTDNQKDSFREVAIRIADWSGLSRFKSLSEA